MLFCALHIVLYRWYIIEYHLINQRKRLKKKRNSDLPLQEKEILEIYRNKKSSRVTLGKRYGITANDVGRIKNGLLFPSVTDANGRTAKEARRLKMSVIRVDIRESNQEIKDLDFQMSFLMNKRLLLQNEIQLLTELLGKTTRL